MKSTGILTSNVFSPLGCSTAENFKAVLDGKSGVSMRDDGYYTAKINSEFLIDLADKEQILAYTRFEQIAILSIKNALQNSDLSMEDSDTLFILSTTKGNIDLLGKDGISENVDTDLFATAQKIANYFHALNRPIVVSTACISGLMALITGQRMIRSGLYKHAVICGADLVSEFVSSGFKSFLALSEGPCKPFDANRNGINLGEAAATVILTNDEKLIQKSESVMLREGAGSNDANHISGPSRTGEELSLAITNALKKSKVPAEEVGFVSAHGTATLYNDEMEAKAFHLSNLSHASVNSLKGNFGHTLGAAGLLETIISTEALKRDLILPTKGFQVSGVSVPLKVSIEPEHQKIQHFIKTASGFGGCNAAMLFSKQN